ncbi:disease resistance protein At4g27190-like [Cannabis sativa]|uniref:disease resistance protein At4g27190-like n=1 Tax=Cannabis sativa TaxID=3483 RepID=UPI0029CA08DA|nr:disease resistance protein At4g27190-like [Cannabis sativa]
MEIVISVVAKIAEYTLKPVGRQLGYLFYYTRNVEKLNTQLQQLNDAQNRLQRRVQDAQNNCQVIEADVTTWLATFGQISQEANTFLNHPDHATVVCSCGSPPHLLMRHRLSRKATKMSIQVHELKEECKFDTIAYPPHLHTPSTTTAATATTTTLAAATTATTAAATTTLAPTAARTTLATTSATATATTSATTTTLAAATTTLAATAATTATKEYESFNSRRVILEGIMTAVRDGNRRRIGLHGMGGIGKTMLAKEIAKLAKEEELFSKVVITTISQAPNIKEIQQHIAEMLDMTTFSQNESIDKRAQLLRTRLEQDESKILLILDDIWKELNLEEIGIHDGCKILVTSRYLHVLRNSMGMAESDVFFIGALESSEAIDLFKKIIGDTKVENNAYYKALALKIVEECAGLPIAIATVAHALKCYTDDSSMWKDALQRLRSSNFTGIEGMHDKVYLSIRLSYDFLGSQEEEAKLLLLLCALHKEDEEIQVEDLIRYFVGWRSLQGIYRVEDARNRVNSLVVKLKAHCLLLDCRDKGRVKMHDVIRDVCITIGKEDHGHRMMSNIVMYEDERPKASKAISFADYDDFYNLPPELECPNLELLLLSSGSTLESIPDEFFKQTGLLKVLIMNGTCLRSLPSSFPSLQNLQTLCLCRCFVEDTTMIGELKNLKALDLSWNDSIKRLPKEIGVRLYI